MKKSSKIISIVLAAVLAMSCFAGLSLFSASAADETTYIYFEVPTLESWGTTKSVYCHIYNVYGGSALDTASWGSRAEQCTKDSATGLYYFDTTKVGTIEDGADYAVLFYTQDTNKAEHQTGNVTLGKDCLGDTIYVTGEMIENTEDSAKMDFEGAWRNNSDKYGAKAALTSTGKIVGKYFPRYQPKEQIVSQFLRSWAVKNYENENNRILSPEIVQADCAQLDVAPMDVYNQYATDYAAELEAGNPETASLATIAELLGVDPNATTVPETTVPETTVPETTVPETTVPETTVPETTVPETTESFVVYGDVDKDGSVTVMDATLIQKAGINMVTLDAAQTTLADVNQDGRVSILDVTMVQKYLAEVDYKNIGVVGQPSDIAA